MAKSFSLDLITGYLVINTCLIVAAATLREDLLWYAGAIFAVFGLVIQYYTRFSAATLEAKVAKAKALDGTFYLLYEQTQAKLELVQRELDEVKKVLKTKESMLEREHEEHQEAKMTIKQLRHEARYRSPK